jgi:cell division protein DivIC
MKIRIRKKRVLGLIGLISGFCFSWFYHSQLTELATLQNELDQKKATLIQLKVEEELLQREIKNLGDYDYVAELARREFFLSKENEIIFVLPTKDSIGE